MDRTAQLLWRLKNGNIPKVNFPKVVVTLIGTNDLGDSPGAVDSVMFRCEGRERGGAGGTTHSMAGSSFCLCVFCPLMQTLGAFLNLCC